MSIKIKLMADYGCDPLWWEDDDKVGNIDPTILNLSPDTIKRLDKWVEEYEAFLNLDEPNHSEVSVIYNAEEAFEQEGINLWKQLRKELAPNYEVLYFSESLRKIVSNPNELEAAL
ncbi:hypothetical protein [Floridanema aerugineum]|uniref:Uncharacterized protein n=1 Tax=Floridaenema aerugineum BLCC-F46 TaxID=3153654 RepID=A0ABV4X3Y8_9CYAN